MKDIKEIVSTKAFRTVLILFASLLVILATFAAGIHIGERKARYSYQWGANYEKNFAGPGRDERGPRGMMGGPGAMGFSRDFQGAEMRNPHGLAGIIVSVNGSTIVVKDSGNKENTISATDATFIKAGRDSLKISDLKTDEHVVVLGKPGDNGTINADLIRVFPNDTNNNL